MRQGHDRLIDIWCGCRESGDLAVDGGGLDGVRGAESQGGPLRRPGRAVLGQLPLLNALVAGTPRPPLPLMLLPAAPAPPAPLGRHGASGGGRPPGRGGRQGGRAFLLPALLRGKGLLVAGNR